MVTANQKSLRDIKEIKTKKSNYNNTESHQYTREQKKRMKKEKKRTGRTKKNNQKTINKMAIIIFLKMITLDVNGLSTLIKRQVDKDVVHLYNEILLSHKKE